jgi:hypothetical protein
MTGCELALLIFMVVGFVAAFVVAWIFGDD